LYVLVFLVGRGADILALHAENRIDRNIPLGFVRESVDAALIA
jgi:hypothetical protein